MAFNPDIAHLLVENMYREFITARYSRYPALSAPIKSVKGAV